MTKRLHRGGERGGLCWVGEEAKLEKPGYSDMEHCPRQFFHFRAHGFIWKRMTAVGFQSSLYGPARDGSWRMLEPRWTPDLPATSSPTPLQSVPSTKQWTMNTVALGLTRKFLNHFLQVHRGYHMTQAEPIGFCSILFTVIGLGVSWDPPIADQLILLFTDIFEDFFFLLRITRGK